MLNRTAVASSPGSARPPVPPRDREGKAFLLAASVLAELQRRRILPTPTNYNLWFTFKSGGSAALSARMASVIERGEAFTPELLAVLHEEFLADVEAETIEDTAGELQEAANAIAGDVADGAEAMRNYGQTLAECGADLAGATIGGLVQTVATLTVETAKAAERNQTLQRQLAASAARVSKLQQALVEVRQEATTDGLTGINNRRAFEAKLRRAIAKAKSELEAAPVSVLLLDIDHFKQFNDAHGHKIGDLVLRLVGRVLADNVKGRDTVARYGGEEFAVLLSGADLQAATIVAEQISAALSSKSLLPRLKGNGLGRITVSVGVAQRMPGDTGTTLIERADLALYRAKHAGRNRVCTERDRTTSP